MVFDFMQIYYYSFSPSWFIAASKRGLALGIHDVRLVLNSSEISQIREQNAFNYEILNTLNY